MVRATLDVDWGAFLKRHDLVYDRIPGRWEEGPFFGNGLLGLLFYNRPESHENPASLRFEVGRTDVSHAGFLTMAPRGRVVRDFQGRLRLWDAAWEGKLTTDAGSIVFRAFVHADRNVAVLEVDPGRGESAAFEWHPAARAGDAPATEVLPDGVAVCAQTRSGGGEYAVAYVAQAGEKGKQTLFLGVGVSRAEAIDAARGAAATGSEMLRRTHERWWHGYFAQSFLSVPDTRLESFYWIQMYRLASATRADRPAMEGTRPWNRDTVPSAAGRNRSLPLAYGPVYAANRLELGEAFLRLLYDSPDRFSEGRDLLLALHTGWLHYRHAMDDALLKDRLVPLLRRAVDRYLPPSSHPPVMPDASHDLALLRWGCGALLDACARLKISDPMLPRWKAVLDDLAPCPADGAECLLPSHLRMVYPLRLTNLDRAEERSHAERSLDHWLARDEATHEASAYTVCASIAALLGRREQAVALLNDFVDRCVTPTTLETDAGLGSAETPLSGATALQELLLRSEPDGSFRVFPAVPERWREAAFHDLRAQGAFLVSAKRTAGSTEFVRVRSLAGEPCRVRTDVPAPVEAVYPTGRRVPVTPGADGAYALDLKKGESVLLLARGHRSEARVTPAAALPGAFANWFGARR